MISGEDIILLSNVAEEFDTADAEAEQTGAMAIEKMARYSLAPSHTRIGSRVLFRALEPTGGAPRSKPYQLVQRTCGSLFAPVCRELPHRSKRSADDLPYTRLRHGRFDPPKTIWAGIRKALSPWRALRPNSDLSCSAMIGLDTLQNRRVRCPTFVLPWSPMLWRRTR